MVSARGTRTSTNQPADSPTRSQLGLVVVKAMEEVDAALVPAEAVDEAAEDSRAVAASGSVADSKFVDAATAMTTPVAVAKVITTAIKAHIMEAPHKDLIIRAMGTVTTTMCTRLLYSLANKLVRPARAFTTLLCPARSRFPCRCPLARPQAPGQQGNGGNCAAPGGQSSVGMGNSYSNFRG